MNATQVLRSSIFAIALCTATLSLAETQTTKTSGDLSDPSFWPNGVIPSDRALLSPTAPANYTISRNVTFAGIRQDVNDVAIDASVGNPTVTMTAPIRISKQRTTIFKGGIYDFGRTCRAFDTGSWSDNVFGSNTITLDACVFTNSTGFWLQNNSLAGCTYTLQNGAGLHVTERLGLTPLSVPASGLSLSVLSGSRVSCSKFQTDKDTGTAYEHEIVVSGAGSSLVTTGDTSDNFSSIGYQRNGKRLLVADGASVDFTANANGFYLGTQGSSSNRVTVTGPGTTARFAKVLLGGWSASSGNKFLILDGATATVTGTFSINGEHSNVRDGELVISNATLNVSKLRANSSYGSGTTVRVQGANPKVTMSGTGSNAGEFIKNTILVFDVPLGGYSTEGPIFNAPSGDIYGDGSATIVVNGLEANYRKLDQKTILWLMHGNQGAQFPASVLAAANAAMPAEVEGRCTLCEKRDLTASEQALFPSAHSRDLFLRIKPLFATTLYIR